VRQARTPAAEVAAGALPEYGTATPFPAEASGPIASGVVGKCADDAGASTSDDSHPALHPQRH
jgi:hypothetical protein